MWEKRLSGRTVLLRMLVAALAIGCTLHTNPPTQVPTHGEPLPGSFHLTASPPLAPFELTIRADDIGGPSGRSAQFEEGEEIVVMWSTLPLPEEKWIEVNGEDCDGTFRIQARIETDLLLVLTDDGCHVQVVGSHPQGDSRHLPVQ